MKRFLLKAKFREFSIPVADECPNAVVVPAVTGTPLLKYGKHAYYFYNFATGKCLCVELSHLAIIRPGLSLFFKALGRRNTLHDILGLFSERHHYGFNTIEQVMLLTVPHTVVSLGNGKFIINLWAYVGYLEIDTKARTVNYITGAEDGSVFGSQQWYDRECDELYSIRYSLSESMAKRSEPYQPVSCAISKRNLQGENSREIWSGSLTDYLHDLVVNRTRQYCAIPELGMYLDGSGKTIPSKVLILDLKSGRHWVLSRFVVAAHAQFDPEEPDIIYFSEHNFQFLPSSLTALLRNATYGVRFNGPASVHKYRLTPDGPVEVGIFTEPDLFRLTNCHVFMHRGRKLLAATGFPNFIYIADADKMILLRKIEILHTRSGKSLWRKFRCVIGTMCPSQNGEKLYVQTSRSFQVVDVESGKPDYVRNFTFNHSCANHMLAATDTDW